MNKKIHLFLLFILIHCLSNTTEKPIILWDLHEVLLEQKNPFWAIVSYPHLSNVIKYFSLSLFYEIVPLAISNLWSSVSSEEYIHLAKKHNNPYLKELILQIANAQHPKKYMIPLLKELNALGYENHIGSNIGPSSYYALINKNEYPQLASIFNIMNLKTSQISNYIDDNIILKKPYDEYYLNYLTKNNIDLKKQPVIFIDDTRANVITAKKLGFDAILFKHPYQLRNELIARGIPLTPPPYTFSNQSQSFKLLGGL